MVWDPGCGWLVTRQPTGTVQSSVSRFRSGGLGAFPLDGCRTLIPHECRGRPQRPPRAHGAVPCLPSQVGTKKEEPLPPAASHSIPAFYFPRGRPQGAVSTDAVIARIEGTFAQFPHERATMEDMGRVAKVRACPLSALACSRPAAWLLLSTDRAWCAFTSV